MGRISLQGLRKRYPTADVDAVGALDLDVDDGELLVLVGPSGCGKSTVLRLVAGLEEPTGGAILLDDRDLVAVSPQHRDVAMVFQGYALYPHMSVRRNIAFPLQMQGVHRAERERRVEETAGLVGLGDKLERLPAELSGGEQQRVAMARAIVRSPALFLFDEPLSNLDAKLRVELRVELAALVRRLGVTALYVTHDQVEAMTMGDRVAVLKGGVLQQVATPQALYEAPANRFVASFVGTPPMNLLALDVEGRKAVGAGVTLLLPVPVEAGRVDVGVRPEHLDWTRRREGAVEMRVVDREPLGAETLVYGETAGGARICARAPGFGGPALGARITLGVEPAHVLCFDSSSGERIGA